MNSSAMYIIYMYTYMSYAESYSTHQFELCDPCFTQALLFYHWATKWFGKGGRSWLLWQLRLPCFLQGAFWFCLKLQFFEVIFCDQAKNMSKESTFLSRVFSLMWQIFQKWKKGTPPKFNIAPEKWWLEDYFPIGKVTFRGYIYNFGRFGKGL